METAIFEQPFMALTEAHQTHEYPEPDPQELHYVEFLVCHYIFIVPVSQGLLPSSISVAFGIMNSVGWWQETRERILSFKSASEKPTNTVK